MDVYVVSAGIVAPSCAVVSPHFMPRIPVCDHWLGRSIRYLAGSCSPILLFETSLGDISPHVSVQL